MPERRSGPERGRGGKGKGPGKPGGRPSKRSGASAGRGKGRSGGDSAGRGKGRRPPERREGPTEAGPQTWGRVARRGAGRLDESPDSAAAAFRSATPDTDPQPWEPEEWIDEGPVDGPPTPAPVREPDVGVRGAATSAVGRGRSAADTPSHERELAAVAGPERAPKLDQRLREAADAFRRERFDDARRALYRLSEEAPAAATVRELHGLALYRLGRWRAAARELEAFRTLTDSTEQHPVLADCYRALGRHDAVADLWDDLRRASPGASIVAEGRIVAAGALADQGNLADAIALLEAGNRRVKRPKDHHLRVRYALADLYERAGDVPRARDLFAAVARAAPEFADVRQRRAALG